MLHPMDRHRPVLAVQVKNALHPQQAVAARGDQHFQPTANALPMQWLRESQTKSRDPIVMAIGIGLRGPVGIGLRIQPPLHIRVFPGRIEQPRVQQRRRINRAMIGNDLRRRINPRNPIPQHRRPIREVGFTDNNPVRHRNLPQSLGVRIQLRRPMHRVHHRHHAVQSVPGRRRHIGHQRRQDRRRIGEARGLDHHPRHLPCLDTRQQIPERLHQIATNGAADAAGIQQNGGLVQLFHQQMIQPDIAEFIHQHRRARQRRLLQQMVQQSGLARPQKPRDHRNRHRRCRFRIAVQILRRDQRRRDLHPRAIACRLVETTAPPGVARHAGLIDAQKNSVAVAVEQKILQHLLLAGSLPLAPQLPAAARPIANPPGGERFRHRIGVHPRHHQHLPGVVLLGDGGHQAVRIEADGGEDGIGVGHGCYLGAGLVRMKGRGYARRRIFPRDRGIAGPGRHDLHRQR